MMQVSVDKARGLLKRMSTQEDPRAEPSEAKCLRKAACAVGPYGRLGNHLYILGTLMDHAAQHNLCYVLTRGLADETLGKVLRLPGLIDMTPMIVGSGGSAARKETGNDTG